MNADPRNLVLRPEAVDALAALRSSLQAGVRARRYTADDAFASYQSALVQTLRRRESYIEVDDARYLRVRCRSCGRPQGAMRNDEATTRYACPCSPAQTREAFIDEINLDGSYRIDPDAVVKAPA